MTGKLLPASNQNVSAQARGSGHTALRAAYYKCRVGCAALSEVCPTYLVASLLASVKKWQDTRGWS